MNTQRLTDLSYLKEIAGGETAVIKEFIELFLEQITEFRNDLRMYLQNQQWEELGKMAHKAKSSVMTFGLNELGLHLKQLQIKTQQLSEIDTYPADVDKFEEVISVAEQELLEDLKRLQ
jgi:HPt (histidine-containing phosphotransfer) domain-containing protein